MFCSPVLCFLCCCAVPCSAAFCCAVLGLDFVFARGVVTVSQVTISCVVLAVLSCSLLFCVLLSRVVCSLLRYAVLCSVMCGVGARIRLFPRGDNGQRQPVCNQMCCVSSAVLRCAVLCSVTLCCLFCFAVLCSAVLCSVTFCCAALGAGLLYCFPVEGGTGNQLTISRVVLGVLSCALLRYVLLPLVL